MIFFRVPPFFTFLLVRYHVQFHNQAALGPDTLYRNLVYIYMHTLLPLLIKWGSMICQMCARFGTVLSES